MVAVGAPVLLEAKPTPSQPTRYGLLQAAVGPLELPIHARMGGLQYVNEICGEGFGYEMNCIDDLDTKEFVNGLEIVTGVPFVVYSSILCGSVGFTQAEFNAMAVSRLLSVEQTIVEQVFSSGDVGQAPSLANNTPPATIIATGGVTAVEVVSELENAMYCTSQYGPPAYLHMPIAVINDLASNHLISWDGTRWRTPMGSIVSAGCYSNLDPDGDAAADGTFWIYATGQTAIWRSPDSEIQVIPIEGTLNRTTNQQLILAEREYVVTFECASYAKAVVLWP
jgi:hypothetical protein